MGIVGESGSGKTTVALALLAYTRRGLEIAGGRVKSMGRTFLSSLGAASARCVGHELLTSHRTLRRTQPLPADRPSAARDAACAR